jgi:Fe-S cluster assembly protein SufD
MQQLRDQLWSRFLARRDIRPFRALSWNRELDAAGEVLLQGPVEPVALEAPGHYGAFLKGFWEREAQLEENPLRLLNGARYRNGLFLYVPPGKQLEEPLQVQGDATLPRAHLVAGRGSQSTLLWQVAHTSWSNGVLDLTVEEGAQCNLVVLIDQNGQACNTLSIRAGVKRSGRLQVWLAARGGTCAHEMRVALMGEGAQVAFKELGWLESGMQLHCRTAIHHQAPACQSTQHFKSVIHAGRSHFEGSIKVDPIAQETDAYQMSNALLLSDDASASHRPNLEIGADQVKATHGSTVGALDPETLFYLRSRGVSLDAARRLAVAGFCNEIMEGMPWGQDRISSWL